MIKTLPPLWEKPGKPLRFNKGMKGTNPFLFIRSNRLFLMRNPDWSVRKPQGFSPGFLTFIVLEFN
jgi:hypothetical protein